MTAPVCTKCGERPASKDGKRGGVQRYRSVCGSCRWDKRMEDIRDERTALYKAAQNAEVRMRQLMKEHRKLDESQQEWVKVADERLRIIEDRNTDICHRDAEIASLKDVVTAAKDSVDKTLAELIATYSENQALKMGNSRLIEQNKSLADDYKESLLALTAQKADYAMVSTELAKLSADHTATLEHKWQWMQRAEDAEARVGEQRETMDGLERGIEDWQDRTDIITAELAQAQSLLKRAKRMVSDGTAEKLDLQSRLADSDGRLLAEKRIVKARDATIREMAEERDHAWITAENQISALKRRIKVLEFQAVSAEERHVTELSQLQALMDSRVAEKETALVSAALILLICLTAAFAAFVGLR